MKLPRFADRPTDGREIYFWNSVAALSNALLSTVLLFLLTRLCGAYEAGIFSLGYANAMLLQHVGSFDSRSHQCADATHRFDFADYLTFRLCTCALMAAATAAFVALNGYPFDKAAATYLLCGFCLMCNISDIFQGLAQVHERLDISGRSLALRVWLNAVVFAAVLVLTDSTLTACAALVVSTALWVLAFDIPQTSVFSRPGLRFSRSHLTQLFVQTFPLFLSLFFQVYCYNMPKYAIDAYLSVEMQTVYGILFMPASVINLCGNFIFKPILITLSQLWEERKYKQVLRMCLVRIGVLAVFTGVVVVVGYWIGTPVLSLIYGIDVTAYRPEFAVILLGGGFSGVTMLLYFMSTVMHRQYGMLGVYFVTLLLSAALAFPLVSRLGLMGAALCYLATSVLLNGLIFLLIWKHYLSVRKKGI